MTYLRAPFVNLTDLRPEIAKPQTLKRMLIHTYAYLYINTYIFIYIYMHIGVIYIWSTACEKRAHVAQQASTGTQGLGLLGYRVLSAAAGS